MSKTRANDKKAVVSTKQQLKRYSKKNHPCLEFGAGGLKRLQVKELRQISKELQLKASFEAALANDARIDKAIAKLRAKKARGSCAMVALQRQHRWVRRQRLETTEAIFQNRNDLHFKAIRYGHAADAFPLDFDL